MTTLNDLTRATTKRKRRTSMLLVDVVLSTALTITALHLFGLGIGLATLFLCTTVFHVVSEHL